MEGGAEAAGRRGQRLIVVSNRLPITLEQAASGGFTKRKSSGGLVAALAGLTEREMIWLGSPGFPPDRLEDAERDELSRQLLENDDCMPVWIDRQTAREHYNDFSNEVLWPLFHYKDNIQFKEKAVFDSYVRANRLFAEAVLQVYREGDLVWVHDYHLMVLPRILREEVRARRLPPMCIAFFLHVPFPTSEVYRILPERKEILEGVLNADLIGFHTYDYARYFVHTCSRVLGVETTANEVVYEGRVANVGVFPVGMDFEKFKQQLRSDDVQMKIADLKRRFEGKTVIIGVDRLDYVKGIPQKLAALERVFQRNESLIGKLVMIQIAVPSREDVEEYQMLRREVETLVGHINTNYGDIGVTPVTYLCKSVPFHDLLGLYAVSDICLVTSLRDGMNLVAQEFVACQQENKGVLILSEFTGAARCLAHALRINPWNVDSVAGAILRAVDMTAQERAQRHAELFKFVGTHAANYWGSHFVEEFQRAASRVRDTRTAEPAERLVDEVLQGRRRLIVVAVEGVLCDIQGRAVAQPSATTLDAVEALARDSRNSVVLVGRQSTQEMDALFGKLPGVILAAERGGRYRMPDREWEDLDVGVGDVEDWHSGALDVLMRSRDRTPGSVVHGREDGRHFTLVWNYQAADPDFGAMQGRDLAVHLAARAHSYFTVDHVPSQRYLECLPLGLTLDRVLVELLRVLTGDEADDGASLSFSAPQGFDTAVYFGNDLTSDQSVTSPFLTGEVICCGVAQLRAAAAALRSAPLRSLRRTRCRFSLQSQRDVAPVLRQLAGLPPAVVDAISPPRLRRVRTLSGPPGRPAPDAADGGSPVRRQSLPPGELVLRDAADKQPENFAQYY